MSPLGTAPVKLHLSCLLLFFHAPKHLPVTLQGHLMTCAPLQHPIGAKAQHLLLVASPPGSLSAASEVLYGTFVVPAQHTSFQCCSSPTFSHLGFSACNAGQITQLIKMPTMYRKVLSGCLLPLLVGIVLGLQISSKLEHLTFVVLFDSPVLTHPMVLYLSP